MNYTHVIWDWNGTLLDDLAWCVGIINIMLKKRGIPVLDSVESYHRVFGFPVIDYYKRVGFDFEREPFETLAEEYIDLYYSKDSSAVLFHDAKEILSELQLKGMHQIVLSASETKNLLSQIKPLGIDMYFDEMLGISDIFATSKINIGKAYIQRTKPGKAVMIGDTMHDKEVADALGIECILVAKGHQSKEALLSCGAIVADNLADVRSLLCTNFHSL